MPNLATCLATASADLSISHCLGVAGDYVFPICDAVDSNAKVKWVGRANELNPLTLRTVMRASAARR